MSRRVKRNSHPKQINKSKSQRSSGNITNGRSVFEPLEGRLLLSYGYSLVGATATVAPLVGAVDSLVIDQTGGLLQHSENGGAFSTDWDDATPGIQTLAANAGSTVNIGINADGSSLQLGTTAGAASTLLAAFNVVAPVNTADTVLLEDSTGAATTYTIDLLPGTLTAAGINYNESASAAFSGGVTLNGSDANSIYNVLSLAPGGPAANEPVTINGGSSAGNVVNVGSNPGTPSSSTLANIRSVLTVTDAPGLMTLNVLDAGDTTSAAANITSTTITGMGFPAGASISYTGGFLGGITALNVFGGTNAGAGITYNIDSSAGSESISVSGGANADTFNVGNAALAGGLDNLIGSVTVNGNGGTDTLNVNDQGNTVGNTYTVTGTTVNRAGFGGLTYGTVESLTLNASTGNDTINVLSTSITTNVNGTDGSDAVNVGNAGDAQGIVGILNISNTIDDNTITIDNSAAAASNPSNIVITSSSVTGLTPAAINYVSGDTIGLTVSTGTADDTVTISSVPDVTVVNTNGGIDTITVTPSAIYAITVNGGDPTTFPGDTLKYAGLGDIVSTGTGSGTIAQVGFGTVTFTTIETAYDINNGLVVEFDNNGKLVITGIGDQDFTNQADAFLVDTNSTGLDIQLTQNGITTFFGLLDSVSQVNIDTEDGNDSLTVDSSNALINVSEGILYNGGLGFNTLSLTQTGGLTQTTDVYNVGPNPGEGSSVITGAGGTQTVYFQNLAPVIDTVPATTATVNATGADNAINYTQGSIAANGKITIDEQESFEFSNKVNLVINGLAGSDEISLNNPTTPTGLVTIAVNGGDPTASDTLVVNGIAGTLDNLRYSPTNVGAGSVVNDSAAQPTVNFTGVEQLKLVVLQTDSDGVRIDGTAGNDNFVFTPGATADSGVFTGTMDANNATGNGPFQTIPVTYFGVNGLANDVDVNFTAPGGTDTFVFNGAAANDTIAVGLGEAAGTDFRNTLNGHVMVRAEVFNIASAIVRGHDGDDIFNHGGAVTIPVSYEGGDPSSSDTLNFTGTGTTAVTVTLPNNTVPTSATVQQTGFGAASITGIEVLNVNTATAALTITGTTGAENLTYEPTAAAAGSVAVVGQNLTIDFTNVDGAFTIDTGAGTDTVTVKGTSLGAVITAVGGATPTVQVAALKTVSLVTANTESLVVLGGNGNDRLTVNSATLPFLIPVTFDGGAGTDVLLLSGGTATADTYTPGLQVGAGSSTLVFAGGTQTVNFVNLEPVIDLVAGPLAVNGTNAADSINYSLGANSGTVLVGSVVSGQVSVNDLETIEFANKTTLTINALSGSDEINLNNASTPAGLTGITVNGGDPTTSDTLIVNGTSVANTFGFLPTSMYSGSVTVTGMPTVTYATVEQVVLNGLAGSDTFNVGASTGNVKIVGGAGSDTVGFGGASAGIVFDMDLVGVDQRPTNSDETVQLGDVVENLVGSDFNDKVSVDATGVARNVNLEDPTKSDGLVYPPGDQLTVDGKGEFVDVNRVVAGQPSEDSGTVTAFGFQAVTFDDVEKLAIVNTLGTTGFSDSNLPAFAPEVTYRSVIKNPAAVASGNLRALNNAWQDLVTVNATGTGYATVYLNNGDGTFQAATSYVTGVKKMKNVELVDMDGDEILDVVTAGQIGKHVYLSVLYGNGDGTFGLPVLTDTGINNGSANPTIAIGDVSGDTNDVFVSNGRRVVGLINSGAQTPFTAGTPTDNGHAKVVDLQLADVTGDGDVDLLALGYNNNRVSLWTSPAIASPGIPTTTFRAGVTVNASKSPTSLSVGDFNNDGQNDLLVTRGYGRFFNVLLNTNNTGTFQPTYQAVFSRAKVGSATVADMNGDGKLDIVSAYRDGQGKKFTDYVQVSLGNGNGTFSTPYNFAVGDLEAHQPQSIVVADFNNDGGKDVAVIPMNAKTAFPIGLEILLRNPII